MRANGQLGPLEWALAAQPISGEQVCGDHWVVADVGHVGLLAVIDGLGHGPHAAIAAHLAGDVLTEHCGEPFEALLKRCHNALTDSRGAAITLALVSYREPSLRWVGVGNVSARLLRETPCGVSSPASAPQLAGVVGDRLPRALVAQTVPIQPNDLLLIATDGLRADFADNVYPRQNPTRLVEEMLFRSARGSDDALVLAACYRRLS